MATVEMFLQVVDLTTPAKTIKLHNFPHVGSPTSNQPMMQLEKLWPHAISVVKVFAACPYPRVFKPGEGRLWARA